MRRWYAAVPVLAVLVLVGPGLIDAAKPEYKAAGEVVLLRYDPTRAETPDENEDPDEDEDEEEEEDPPRNPYTDFNVSVSTTAAVLASVGNGDALSQQVVDSGGTADFTVAKDEDAPILLIEATAGTPGEAIATVSVIVDALEEELASRQERFDVPVEDQIVMEVVLLPEKAARLETARNRALTIIIALGLAGVVATTLMAESYAKGRARNRQEEAERVASERAARMTDAPDSPFDSTPIGGVLRPPGPRELAASNGEPTVPTEQRHR